MKRKRTRALSALIIAAILTLSPSGALRTAAYCDEYTEAAIAPDVKVSSRFLELLFGKDTGKKSEQGETLMLCPGGDVFGARIKEDHVTVMESNGTAGIRPGDIILSICNKAVSSIDDVKRATEGYTEGSIKLKLLRGSEEVSVEITPVEDNGAYKLGLSLRDGAAGIGTVTFIDPETGSFAGLGHGICDAESGCLIEMKSGSITGVILGGVKRGECGKPGELCGVLTPTVNGSLYANTDCGVFGKIDAVDSNAECIPIATKSAVHEGDATIISTVKNGKKCEFSVKIFDVDKSSEGTKSFKIKVTDPVLISLTGGIIRGMSGSPVKQDGKLVGAVTHVMVADPTEGYGIFIENMLNASGARNELPKAA